jgi:hypothetical protein
MQINLIAALVTGVASLVLGFIWYGPLFAKAWLGAVGLSEEQLKGSPGPGYLLAFLSSTLLGAVTSYLVNALGLTDVTGGAGLGALLALGYVVTTFATNYIFAMRSLRLFLIDAGYQSILVIIAGVIAVLIR